MIRQKLGLKAPQALEALPTYEKGIIDTYLPKQKSPKDEDKLNEVYAAARIYVSIYSDRCGKIVDYHWGLVRLSRATLMPLVILAVVFLIRVLRYFFSVLDLIGLFSSSLLFVLTLINYRYREKFLVYTVFDAFFLSTKWGSEHKSKYVKRAKTGRLPRILGLIKFSKLME
jgi:hypothetical protein